jgi:hypothetical protein
VRYIGMGEADTIETKVAIPMPFGGTAAGLQVRTNGAAGNGRQWAFTLYVNGAATTVTCTIAGNTATSCSDGSGTAVLAAGDRVTLQQQGQSNPAAVSVTWSFFIDQ